jgi:hypothetical protein
MEDDCDHKRERWSFAYEQGLVHEAVLFVPEQQYGRWTLAINILYGLGWVSEVTGLLLEGGEPDKSRRANVRGLNHS